MRSCQREHGRRVLSARMYKNVQNAQMIENYWVAFFVCFVSSCEKNK